MPAQNMTFDSDGCTSAGTHAEAVSPVAARQPVSPEALGVITAWVAGHSGQRQHAPAAEVR